MGSHAVECSFWPVGHARNDSQPILVSRTTCTVRAMKGGDGGKVLHRFPKSTDGVRAGSAGAYGDDAFLTA